MPKKNNTEGRTGEGWWELKAEFFDGQELEDSDREHIADCIRQGYWSGQLVK